MLSRISHKSNYAITLRMFEKAAALHDIQMNKNKIREMFSAIDSVRIW